MGGGVCVGVVWEVWVDECVWACLVCGWMCLVCVVCVVSVSVRRYVGGCDW